MPPRGRGHTTIMLIVAHVAVPSRDRCTRRKRGHRQWERVQSCAAGLSRHEQVERKQARLRYVDEERRRIVAALVQFNLDGWKVRLQRDIDDAHVQLLQLQRQLRRRDESDRDGGDAHS